MHYSNRLISFSVIVVMCLSIMCSGWAQVPTISPDDAPSANEGPAIDAVAAIIMDPISKQVLYSKNADLRRPNASTTKMMTALLMMEQAKTNMVVTASPRAISMQYANLNLKPGEKFSLTEMLYAILMRSSNDGCVSAAEALKGNQAAFVANMNARAKQLGCVNTHFMNPHGLSAVGHYSSPHDLALIASECIKHPLFNQIVSTKQHVMVRSINQKDLALRNLNKALWTVPGCDGIKTGYTKEAGNCLAGSVTRNGWRLIIVVMKSHQTHVDTGALADWAFARYQPVDIMASGQSLETIKSKGLFGRDIPVVSSSLIRVVVPKGDQDKITTKLHINSTKLPLKKGQVLGRVQVLVNGKDIFASPAVAGEDVTRNYGARNKIIGLSLLLAVIRIFLWPRPPKGAPRRRFNYSRQLPSNRQRRRIID